MLNRGVVVEMSFLQPYLYHIVLISDFDLGNTGKAGNEKSAEWEAAFLL